MNASTGDARRSHPNFIGYDAIAGRFADSMPEPAAPRDSLLFKIAPPFKKSTLGDYHWPWRKQIKAAHEWASANGATLFISRYEYQLAKVMGAGFRVVIYPGRTTKRGPIVVKCRNEGSRDFAKAEKALEALSIVIEAAS